MWGSVDTDSFLHSRRHFTWKEESKYLPSFPPRIPGWGVGKHFSGIELFVLSSHLSSISPLRGLSPQYLLKNPSTSSGSWTPPRRMNGTSIDRSPESPMLRGAGLAGGTKIKNNAKQQLQSFWLPWHSLTLQECHWRPACYSPSSKEHQVPEAISGTSWHPQHQPWGKGLLIGSI